MKNGDHYIMLMRSGCYNSTAFLQRHRYQSCTGFCSVRFYPRKCHLQFVKLVNLNKNVDYREILELNNNKNYLPVNLIIEKFRSKEMASQWFKCD